jgi:Na+/melibiose symporter-like transporter
MYAGLLVLIGQIADGFATVFVGIFSDKGNECTFGKSFYPSRFKFGNCVC